MHYQEKPLVSIIIPVYGVEKWIEKCAISIFEQDYPNIEVIFVNDATKDNSINILNKTIEKYPHIKQKIKIVTHATNKGLAGTRETGIKSCNGDYIFHIDSDDWLEPNCISALVDTLDIHPDAEIITANCRDIYKSKNVNRKPISTSEMPITIAYSMMERRVIWSIWNRLIKKSLYRDILIPPINNGEDYIMTIQLMYRARKCVYIPLITYNYNHLNETSFQNRRYEMETIVDRLKAVLFLKDLYKDNKTALHALDIGHINVLAINLGQCKNYDDIKNYTFPSNLSYLLTSKKIKPTYKLLLYLLKKRMYGILYLINNLYYFKNGK